MSVIGMWMLVASMVAYFQAMKMSYDKLAAAAAQAQLDTRSWFRKVWDFFGD